MPESVYLERVDQPVALLARQPAARQGALAAYPECQGPRVDCHQADLLQAVHKAPQVA